eukprot:contig_24607_g6065
MSAGPSGGGQADEADDGVEVDMELLRKRMEEVQAGGEGGDEDDDASDISIVVEMSAEVRVPIDNDEDEVVVLELVSSVDSDSDDDSDDDDDADENQDDGPSVMGQLTPPNSSESKEIATAYRDCASLFIILFNSEGEGEGLYSIQVGGQNVVLAFARVEEAGQYARALRDQRIIDVESIVDIQVAELVPSELEEFCSDAGVRLGFVPADALLSPEHLHSTNDATFSPFSSTAPDPLRDGGMAEGEADELREKLNKLLGKEGGDA